MVEMDWVEVVLCVSVVLGMVSSVACFFLLSQGQPRQCEVSIKGQFDLNMEQNYALSNFSNFTVNELTLKTDCDAVDFVLKRWS
jgi:hypothetical protein